MEVAWKRHGGCMEVAWRWHGGPRCRFHAAATPCRPPFRHLFCRAVLAARRAVSTSLPCHAARVPFPRRLCAVLAALRAVSSPLPCTVFPNNGDDDSRPPGHLRATPCHLRHFRDAAMSPPPCRPRGQGSDGAGQSAGDVAGRGGLGWCVLRACLLCSSDGGVTCSFALFLGRRGDCIDGFVCDYLALRAATKVISISEARGNGAGGWTSCRSRSTQRRCCSGSPRASNDLPRCRQMPRCSWTAAACAT